MSETSAGAAPSPARALSDASRLFVELAETMQGLGYPANTTEASIRRAARGMGIEVDVLVLQSVVLVEVRRDGWMASAMRRLPLDFRYRLYLIRDVDDLVGALARGTIDVSAGVAALGTIRSRTGHVSTALFLAGSSVYSAAVAARLGGAWLEMIVAALIALGGRAIGLSSRGHGSSTLVRTFVVGLAGALVTLAVAAATRGLDAPAALFGGVVLMVPSMVMTMAAHELGGNLLETGSMRLTYALLRFVMLAAGIAAGVRLWELTAALPPSVSPAALPWWVMTAVLVVGGAAVTMSLQAAYRDMPWIIGAVLFAVAAQKASEAVLGEASCAPLVSAFALGTVAYLQARIPGHAAPTMIVPGLLQLVPGFLGTKAVLALLAGTELEEGATLLHVLLIAIQLAVGLALASALFREWSARE